MKYKSLKKQIYFLGYIGLFIGMPNLLQAQTPRLVPSDTTTKKIVPKDSINNSKEIGTIQTTVFYESQDSIIYEFGSRELFMHGTSAVKYGALSLDAEEIDMNMVTSLMEAKGKKDTIQKKTVGLPIFKDGEDVYDAKYVLYNFKTKRAIIKGIITEEGEGFVHGNSVKKNEQGDFIIQKSVYTTCNLTHPHYAIHSKQLKVTPGKHLASDFFYLSVADVPTFLGFPVGLFPLRGKRASGIVVPSYGESQERGFYLRNGGLYLALGDYVDFKALGSIYTLGGWGMNNQLNYKVRYKLSGSFNFNYTRRITGTNPGQIENRLNEFWLSWTHNPVTRGKSRYNVNVNFGTSTYQRNNSFSTNDFLSSSFASNISYSTSFFKVFRFNSGIGLNQNVLTNVAILSPRVSLSTNAILPFKTLFKPSTSNILTKLSFSYTGNSNLRIDNIVDIQSVDDEGMPITTSDTLDLFSDFSRLIEEPPLGASHGIPISTSFNIFKYITASPSFNLRFFTYPQRLAHSRITETNTIDVDTVQEFSIPYTYSTNIGFNTRLYSFFYFKGGAILRSQLTPNISFNYTPDFSEEKYGFYSHVPDTTGEIDIISRYSGPLFTAGGPGRSESLSTSFGLSSVLELKVKDRKDSTGLKTKKIKIFDNISIGSSYNFAADSFQLSTFRLAARTTLFKIFNINLSGTLDPYFYQFQETGFLRTSALAYNVNGTLGRLTNIGLAVGAAFTPDIFKKKSQIPKDNNNETDQFDDLQNEYPDEVIEEIQNNPNRYVDFKIPWSLNVRYNITRSHTTQEEPRTIQTLNFSGDFKLTDKWKIGFNSGYDFENKDFSFTSVNINRDLHCWQMTMSWIPFGPRQSYNFIIQVKASILQDLKLTKKDVWFDRQAAF